VSRLIPAPVVAALAISLGERYSHAQIDDFMQVAGLIWENKGVGNKNQKGRAWLDIANRTKPDPMGTVGNIIHEYMEEKLEDEDLIDPYSGSRERLRKALAGYGFEYFHGGQIVALGSTPISKTLQEIISTRDLVALQTEFNRIYANLESDPPAAVTASCALLESLFKSYIEQNDRLTMPGEQSIKPLWKVIKKDLKLDPAIVDDDDLKTILTGLASIVEGTGSLRTHKGSAHGRGKTQYKLKPRHARLAAHAAFTLASFLLEAWNERK